MLARSDIERAREVWREIQSRISAANNRDACPAGCVPLPAAKTSLGSQLRADLLDEFQGFTKAMRRQYGGNIDIPQWIGLFPPGQAIPLESGASSHQWVAQQIKTGFHDKPQFAIEPAKWEEIHVKVAAHMKDVERWFAEGIEQLPSEATLNETDAPLTAEDAQILQELLARHPVLATQYDLEAATLVSRRTLTDRLQKMEDTGIVHRPHGERKGFGLTNNGKSLALKIKPAH